MFCKNCGSEIDKRATVCPKCGVVTGIVPNDGKRTPNSNPLSIIALLLTIAGIVTLAVIGCVVGVKSLIELFQLGFSTTVGLLPLYISAIFTASKAEAEALGSNIYLFPTLMALFVVPFVLSILGYVFRERFVHHKTLALHTLILSSALLLFAVLLFFFCVAYTAVPIQA